jgi:AraC family transcriptional regulator
MKYRQLVRFLLLALLPFVVETTAFGQTAQVTGRISDQSGAVIQGAMVTVTNEGNRFKRETSSNEEGYFTVPSLQPGSYQVSIQKDGFKPVIRSGIVLNVEQVARLDFTLQPGTVTEIVEVQAGVVALDSETASIGQIVTHRQVNDLPLNGRNFLQLLFLGAGAVDFQEREDGQPWITNRIKKGSFFLTTGGAPYDVRWRAVSPEPYETMLVFVELPVLQRAMEEVFEDEAARARLRDASAFNDEGLNSLLGLLREELMRGQASPLFVQSIAQAIAVYLARNYGVTDEEARSSSPSLPGYKLRQITDWMAEHVAEYLNLARLAAQAGLSKFHFERLFKSALGVSPSRYRINLRVNLARRLRRETKKSVVDVALEVGYADPSHFAKLFRRETGLSPSDYRRQR